MKENIDLRDENEEFRLELCEVKDGMEQILRSFAVLQERLARQERRNVEGDVSSRRVCGVKKNA